MQYYHIQLKILFQLCDRIAKTSKLYNLFFNIYWFIMLKMSQLMKLIIQSSPKISFIVLLNKVKANNQVKIISLTSKLTNFQD